MVKSEEQVAKEVGWWFERLLTKLESERLRERLRDEKLAAARRFADTRRDKIGVRDNCPNGRLTRTLQ